MFQVLNSKGVTWLQLCDTFGGCNFYDFFLWLSLLTPCSFPWRSHDPGFCHLPESPLHLQLHPRRFTHCPLWGTLPSLPGLLKSGWKISKPCHPSILLAPNTGTMWMIPRFASRRGAVFRSLLAVVVECL